MTVSNPKIPADFTRLDDRVTDPDQYLNVHDYRKAYENHNILIARRLRRPLLTMGQAFDIKAGVQLNQTPQVPPILEIPVLLSPSVSELDFNFYGYRTSGQDCDIYVSCA